METRDFFIKNQVFRHEEFANFMRRNKGSSANDINKTLFYHIKAGHIVNIRRNLYASIVNVVGENYWIDPYLIAAKASTDSVIAYHSALELHGAAYTTFEELTYISCNSAESFMFQNQLFKNIKPPVQLLKSNATNKFVDEIVREGVKIKVTSLERTIVDVLNKPRLSGGWEEIWRSLEYAPGFNSEKVVNYALLLGNITTIAKVGYFLRSLPLSLKVDELLLDKLKTKIPKAAHYINRSKKSKFIKEWSLMVPLEIINKTWEEPNEDFI